MWQVDHRLVVADTVNEAVELFKAYMGKDFNNEPYSIQAISSDHVLSSFNALIKEEEKK